MGPGLSMKTETNAKLPFSFILFSLIGFITAQWFLFSNSEFLAQGIYRTPNLWMAAHFLILSWAVMVVMGAMYQLVPVAFLTPIWSEKFGFFQFVVTAIGIIGLSVTFSIRPTFAIYPGILAIVGILLFLFQMFMTIRKQEKKTIITGFVLSALVFFFLTIVAGGALAANFAFGVLIDHEPLFYSHLLFGITGWFTLLIFGFSYKMVPMFSLSHGFKQRWAIKALAFYLIGMIILFASFWLEKMPVASAGWFILWLAFSLYVLDMHDIIKRRLKKKLDRPFQFSLVAIMLGWVLHGILFFTSILAPTDQKLWSLWVYLYIMMWIIFSILGYLYKIVPFLWWTYKYSAKVGKEKVPVLKDMINEKMGVVLFLSFSLSMVGIGISGFTSFEMGMQLFQGILLVTTILYSGTIFIVLKK
ncbi:hypothetical protein RZN25_01280 [Bacillaceae bacterium S4-13-56]